MQKLMQQCLLRALQSYETDQRGSYPAESILQTSAVHQKLMHMFHSSSVDSQLKHRQVYVLISFPAMSLLGLDSFGCLYRYITARPMPLCFRVSWLTLGSCRERGKSKNSNKLCLNINGVTGLCKKPLKSAWKN